MTPMHRKYWVLWFGVLSVGCSSNSGSPPQGSSAAGTAAVAGTQAAPPAAMSGTGAVGGRGPTAGVASPAAGTGAAGRASAGTGAAGMDLDDAGVAPPSGGAGSTAGAGAGGGAGGMMAPTSPPTGTFPAVTDLMAKGPYTAKTVTNTGPNNAYTLYHPTELAPGGVRNPVVSWGNGGGTTPNLYPMLPHLATHGFVVIASNSSSATGPLLKGGIDWLEKQNADTSSMLHDKLDMKNVSGVGYSLGGLATYAIADDARLVTVVIISGANMADKSPVAKLHTPTAYLCTDDAASEGNCDGDFAVVKVPSFYGVMKGTGHVDVALDSGVSTLLSKVVTGWLRWHQMQDQTQKPTFVGPDCVLCKDSKWVVMQKNGLM